MKINGNEIRPGTVIEHQDSLWLAVKVHSVKPGKGGAFAQVELKNLLNGRKLNERFRSADKVETARVEARPFQYLYAQDEQLVFMNLETYDQIEVGKDILGEKCALLSEGLEVTLELYEGRPVTAKLPAQVKATISEADAVVKGQTATSSYKPAVLDNGLKVLVPPFVGMGETIVIDTETLAYVRRAE